MPGYMNPQQMFLKNALDRPSVDLTEPSLLQPSKVAMGLGSTPSLPTNPGGISPDDGKILGMNPLAFSSTLAGLGTALAPIRYDKRGNKIETWQGNVGKVLGDMFRAQQMAQALNSGDGANPGVNKMLLSLMLGGGK